MCERERPQSLYFYYIYYSNYAILLLILVCLIYILSHHRYICIRKNIVYIVFVDAIWASIEGGHRKIPCA
jgi:hypothetical protein